MFMHDLALSGRQSAQTGITSVTVPNLQLRWTYSIGEQTVSSPAIADGLLYIVTGVGSVIAFDERTGSVRWRTQINGAVSMSPTVDSGLLFVATHNPPAKFFALDEQSGAIRWTETFNGSIRSEPAVAQGMVLVGEAGGDPPACHQGGVQAFQALTGAPLWTWHVNPKPNDGGSVWAPVSFGGRDFVVGTGNSCSVGAINANTVVRLTPAGTQEWGLPQQVSPVVDDDWGGGATISNGNLFVANKNGYFYGINGSSGQIIWKVQLSPFDGAGSYATPATDGTHLVIPSGWITFPTLSHSAPSSSVVAYNENGVRLWSVPTGNRVYGGGAITNDLVFFGLDVRLAALDLDSGKELWTYPTPGGAYIQAPPVIVSSGIYAVDIYGTVYAFSLGTSSAGQSTRAPAAITPARARVQMRYGPVSRQDADGIWHPVF
ncbi:MAG: PQQ-binding-like beta-propeller repeat protein [Candidatus Eremiobacteraeota bacterium]|nr:PQQ-binding-like beta-propeller repeat protein [Candidatus Eremiobacteraeota bacterium]